MPRFKNYTMDQLQLPLSFDEIIPENHLVRVVNTIVDSLNLDPLYDRYKTGGNKPDFRTVNRFRSDMKDIIDDVFYDVVRINILLSGIKRSKDMTANSTKKNGSPLNR